MDISKKQILTSAGYEQHFDRNAYLNRRTKKVFAVEIVDDNSEDWLTQKINEPNTTGRWRFYSNPAPSDETVREFIKTI